MSLLIRLLLLLITSGRRSRLHVLDTCVTPFRVWLNDLDVLLHMNNGRYFTILDLARVDLMMRSGLWRQLKAQGWYPVVTLETMRFHRSLELGDRYNVQTRVIGWDEKHIFIEQGFVRDDVQVALAVVRARFVSDPSNPTLRHSRRSRMLRPVISDTERTCKRDWNSGHPT